ncbi:MAG: RNA 2',3'-cyclic phosphodiesterase [Betaproteobacteria bacterium]|jgi:2'-5' RNA ligase|nr:MAG: RNA 2',3'-cyclic phosphodiesterase [Betaproteobacteria bacterium]
MSSAPGANHAAQRLFFALWPNAKLQAALHLAGESLQKAFGGRVVRTENIHLTLAFLGSVPAERADELRGIGSSITVERFQLKLTETGCWKRSAVGWIAPESLPEPLKDLMLDLRSRLLAAGFRVDDKPFAPHVTLLRKAKCRPQPAGEQIPLEWRVDHFTLMRSDTLPDGPQYSQVGTWPLS